MRDPARPDVPLDVLGEDVPAGHGTPRRRATSAAVVVLAVAVVAGGLELRERREAAEQERRLAAVVDLSVLAEGTGQATYDALSGLAQLDLSLNARNRGPRALTVLEAEVAGYELTRPVELPTGGRASLPLTRSIACSPTRPPAQLTSRRLSLRVRTGAGDRDVDVQLPSPVGDDQALRLCGYLPLEEAAFVNVAGASEGRGAAEVVLQVLSSSVRPTDVVDIVLDEGLRVEPTEQGGTPLAFPIPLLVQGPDTTTVTTVRLALTVSDCPAAQRIADRGRTPQLRVLLRDERGRVAEKAVDLEGGHLLVGALVGQTC